MSGDVIELATVVPVLDRPQNVEPLVLSWLTSQTPGHLYFVCELDDLEERAAIEFVVRNHRVHVISVIDAHTWPEKVNVGVTEVDADWYLLAADDIEFTRGWWRATEKARKTATVGVIGTNDSKDGTGNQAVAAGTHTCHPLVRGSYIRDCGTIDEKGVVAHTGYHHWCVDNEIVETAKTRGAWKFVKDAVLVHKHPYWNGGQGWDGTYALGEARAREDLLLWKERSQLLTP